MPEGSDLKWLVTSGIDTFTSQDWQFRFASRLSHYVTMGVEKLSREKLNPLLGHKYHDSVADAVADLGKTEEIGKMFAGF